MNLKELGKLLEERTEDLTFTHAEILKMHTIGCLMDHRSTWSKFLRKHFTPVALTLNQNYPEYVQDEALRKK